MRKRSYMLIIRIQQDRLRLVFPIPLFLASTALRISSFIYRLTHRSNNAYDHFFYDQETIKGVREIIRAVKRLPPFVLVDVQNEDGRIIVKTK